MLKKYSPLRVVNRWDPVAVLPLILSRTHFELQPTMFYHHVGPQVTLYRERKPKYSAPTMPLGFLFGFKRFIANHFVDLYLRRIQVLLE